MGCRLGWSMWPYYSLDLSIEAISEVRCAGNSKFS